MTIYLFPKVPMSERAARSVLASPNARQSRQLRQLAWATLRAVDGIGNSVRAPDHRNTGSRAPTQPPDKQTGGSATTHQPRSARQINLRSSTDEGAK